MIRRVLLVVVLVASAAVPMALGGPWLRPPVAREAVRPAVLDEPAALRAARLAAPPPRPHRDPPDSIEVLRQQIAAVLERERVPGVAIALVGRDGAIWSGGVGVADLATRTPVDGDTVFRVASITKNVVGLGAMRLVEAGRLDLARPIGELVPEAGVDNRWHADAPVTLAHVLEHTAGLDDMRFNEYFVDADDLAPAAALAINPRSRRVRWRPGSRMAYSNVGYTLAARAIERATGEPFDAWLVREVIRPLGMRDADFRRTGALAARLATGYFAPGEAAPFRPLAHRPAGALLASATDLAQLVRFWLRRGDGMPAIVSRAGLARVEHAGTLAYPPLDVTYGLGNYSDVSHPVRAHGHDGGLPGFLSTLRYFPELDLGYVILFNATHSWRAVAEVRDLVFAYLVRGHALPPLPEVPAGEPPPLAPFYGFASPRTELFAFVDRALLGWHPVPTATGLRLDPLVGRPTELVPAPGGAYRRPHESGSSFRFTADATGRPVMMIDWDLAEQGSANAAWLRVTALGIAMLLLQLAPIWGLSALGTAAVRRRRAVAVELVMWPAIASLCLGLLPTLFGAAADRQVLGERNALTLAICLTTVAFAAASIAGMTAVVRWSLRADRPSRWRRLVPNATALAALGMTIWLGSNGIIGVRTWAW